MCLVASVSFSQVSDDFKFANHLLNTKRVSESVNYLEYRLKSSFNDCLNFVYGKSLFYLKDFSKAKSVFSQIPINHQLIKETRFYYGLSKLYEGQTLSAKFISDSLPNEELTQLFSFGNNILKDTYTWIKLVIEVIIKTFYYLNTIKI